MATLKLKHLLLYLLAFLFLYFSQMPGGALLAIAAWMQIGILLWKLQYTTRNQGRMLIYFLTLIPLFLFLGSISSFVTIYLKETSFLFLLFATILTWIICFFVALLTIFVFQDFDRTQKIADIYGLAFSNIKNIKQKLTVSALALMLITLLPIPIQQDFKIVLAIILIHLFLHRKQVRPLIFRQE